MEFVDWMRRYALNFAWLVSLAATAGSLFFSEVMHYTPCKLCWFQRILMYPLVLLLGRACYTNDRRIIGYALPFSILGAIVALYHYAQQKIPSFGQLLPCTEGVPCNASYINWAGFITIPFLAFVAFVLVSIFLVAGSKRATQNEDQHFAA